MEPLELDQNKAIHLEQDLYCPVCWQLLDGVLPLSGKKKYPAVGDMTVCTSCGYILAFVGPPLHLKEVGDDQLRNIARENTESFHMVAMLLVVSYMVLARRDER
jgi:hypothetical protein